MAISTMTPVLAAGDGSGVNLKARRVRWTGDAVYPDGGSAIETILRATCLDQGLTPVALIPGDSGVYRPLLTETPATLVTAATWNVADQDTETLIYSLNGAADVTITFASTQETRAQLAVVLDAIDGIHAYDDGVQVTVKTIRTGPGASFQITGGTSNAVYLFSTTAVVGTTAKLVKVMTQANVDSQVGVGTTDLSGTEFNATFLCE